MKVLYDHQIFANQQFGGISRVYYDLMRTMIEQKSADVDLALESTPNFYLLQDQELQQKLGYKKVEQKDLFGGVNFRGKRRLYKAIGYKPSSAYEAGRISSEAKLKAQQFDVFHPTYFDPYFLNYIEDKPYVIGVYDMIHEIFPEYLPVSEHQRIADKKKTLTQATRLLAISQTTKNDVVRILGIPEDKVDVAYLTNSLGTSPVNTSLNLPQKYIFFLGHRWHYKNFLLLAEVFAEMSRQDPELYLVCAGGGAFNSDEQAFFAMLGITEKIVHVGGQDQDIRAGYAKARALVSPSMYEGFGLPLIEAFELNCPVVCADTAIYREIAADAAEFFAPKSWEAMSAALKNVVYNDERRRQLQQLGLQRSRAFSLQNFVNSSLACYQKALDA